MDKVLIPHFQELHGVLKRTSHLYTLQQPCECTAKPSTAVLTNHLMRNYMPGSEAKKLRYNSDLDYTISAGNNPQSRFNEYINSLSTCIL